MAKKARKPTVMLVTEKKVRLQEKSKRNRAIASCYKTSRAFSRMRAITTLSAFMHFTNTSQGEHK